MKTRSTINPNYEEAVFYLFHPRHTNHLLSFFYFRKHPRIITVNIIYYFANLRIRQLWDLKSHSYVITVLVGHYVLHLLDSLP